jgi:group I intron endonuclease
VAKVCGIYQILNTVNGKSYIGSSKQINERLREHRYKLNKGIHTNSHLQAAWTKYGKKVFTYSAIVECLETDLLFYEDLIISGYKSNNRKFGYNQRIVTESNSGLVTKRTTNKPGEKFNRLTLIEPLYIKNRRRFWLCKCDCGTVKELCVVDVRKGHTKSCGCLQTERQLVWLKEQHKKGPWNKGMKHGLS